MLCNHHRTPWRALLADRCSFTCMQQSLSQASTFLLHIHKLSHCTATGSHIACQDAAAIVHAQAAVQRDLLLLLGFCAWSYHIVCPQAA